MSDQDVEPQEDASLKTRITHEIERAKGFVKTLHFDQVKSGEWFMELLRKVVAAYDRNARAEYFQQKYPGLAPDEIADILTSVTVRYAAIAGAIAGAAATANQLSILSSAGMTAALFVGTIGAEMIYLARIQMRLVLDLAVVYDLQLNPDDPEDILMIFGYAMGVTPTELLGKGLQIAAGATTKGAVKKYISKATLQAIQDFAKKLGFKILQRTIIKYAVPMASAAVGSGYNYVTTQSVGKIARAHLKNRGKVTEELRVLVSRQNTYDLAFPAAVMYMAQIDGRFLPKEQELYRAMLTRMSFDDHTQAQFQRLISNEDSILQALAQMEDEELGHSLIDVLVLMASCDGELAQTEREFLVSVAEQLNLDVDITEVEDKAQGYQVIIKQNILQRTAGVVSQAAVGTAGAAGHAASTVKGAAAKAGDKVKSTFGSAFRHRKAICPNCGRRVSAEFQFCPGCGQAIATEKSCVSCGKSIEISFAFCPHCGASQD